PPAACGRRLADAAHGGRPPEPAACGRRRAVAARCPDLPPGVPMSLLTLVGVGYDLLDGPLFEDVDLNLAAGSRVALVGENGAGKTTLMRLALGELEPARGRVERRGTVAWLPQELGPVAG